MAKYKAVIRRLTALRGFIGEGERYDLYSLNEVAVELLDSAAAGLLGDDLVEMATEHIGEVRRIIAHRFNIRDTARENEGMALCREALDLLPSPTEGPGEADPLGSPESLADLKVSELRALLYVRGIDSSGMLQEELRTTLAAALADAAKPSPDDDDDDDEDFAEEDYEDDDDDDDEDDD